MNSWIPWTTGSKSGEAAPDAVRASAPPAPRTGRNRRSAGLEPEDLARAYSAHRVGRTTTHPQLPDEAWQVVDKAERHLDKDLDWYKALTPADRDQLNLIIETAVSDFLAWLNATVYSPLHKTSTPSTDHIFFVAPLEFTKSITLKQALQVTRLIVSILERNVGKLARRGKEEVTRNAMLYYAREVAFSAANVYASSAEARGDWDARLEALAIEDLIDGVTDHHVASRLSMLGWPAEYDCFAVIGSIRAESSDDNNDGIGSALAQRHLRMAIRQMGGECVMSYHDNMMIMLIDPRSGNTPEGLCDALLGQFDDRKPVCLGPLRHGIEGASATIRAALSTIAVIPALNEMHRPLRADDALPERALFGDEDARMELYRTVYCSLRNAGESANAPSEQAADNPLLATVATFLRSGSSLETTARELNVHPNTVRYRLKRSVELTGWDPLTPREAYVLTTAIAIGRVMDAQPSK